MKENPATFSLNKAVEVNFPQEKWPKYALCSKLFYVARRTSKARYALVVYVTPSIIVVYYLDNARKIVGHDTNDRMGSYEVSSTVEVTSLTPIKKPVDLITTFHFW